MTQASKWAICILVVVVGLMVLTVALAQTSTPDAQTCGYCHTHCTDGTDLGTLAGKPICEECYLSDTDTICELKAEADK